MFDKIHLLGTSNFILSSIVTSMFNKTTVQIRATVLVTSRKGLILGKK